MTHRFFHTSHSTGSDDGLWTSIIAPGCVAVVDLSYWADLDSSAVATYGKYNVVSGYVHVPDPRRMSERERCELGDCLTSYGWRMNEDHDIVDGHSGDVIAVFGRSRSKSRRCWTLAITECMWRYGRRDRIDDISGNYREQLFRRACRGL